MSQILAHVGSDVSKAWLDVYLHPLGQRRRFANTAAGIAELVAWLRELPVAIACIGMEASGGYERDAARGLTEAGFAVCVLDPMRVRRFAQASAVRAKNDAIDARLIAAFIATFRTNPVAFDPERDRLAELCQARRSLLESRIRIANAAEHQRDGFACRILARRIRSLDVDVRVLDAAIAKLLAATPRFAATARLLRSVKGVGAITAATLIALLPELGTASNKQITALVGLAPFDHDSGAWRGQRHIAGGRAAVRCALYMAAMAAATRHNPWLKTFYQRLRQRGKPAKLALTACMRKLLCLLNTIIARGYPWQPALA